MHVALLCLAQQWVCINQNIILKKMESITKVRRRAMPVIFLFPIALVTFSSGGGDL